MQMEIAFRAIDDEKYPAPMNILCFSCAVLEIVMRRACIEAFLASSEYIHCANQECPLSTGKFGYTGTCEKCGSILYKNRCFRCNPKIK